MAINSHNWIQDSKSAEFLGLTGPLASEWAQYMNLLKHSAIGLTDSEEELKWSKNKATGVLTAKTGYLACIKEEASRGRTWWWKVVWKLDYPLKT